MPWSAFVGDGGGSELSLSACVAGPLPPQSSPWIPEEIVFCFDFSLVAQL